MATVLALETSADACSVALLRDGSLLQRHELLPRSHTLHILPMVDAVMVEAGISLAALDVIAFGRGPGSFTGLRVCASVVQGLAYAADIPCAPVSSLQALAMTALDDDLCAPGLDILCCVDARMNEVYCAQFTPVDGFPLIAGAERLCAPDATAWGDVEACRIGSGWQYADKIGFSGSVNSIELLPRASAVARLGEQMFKQGQTVAADEALPVYLRDDVAWR
ncbi:MAG: tRNA threonylcarbamoyladenosine biosynthesis protein TsaB [Bermanella sp.]|jgi:tRNA threonylcarbamoyladenosine biosynthesis protein TsaB